jgi:5-methylcytosine-specific restriction endonuclease McrA
MGTDIVCRDSEFIAAATSSANIRQALLKLGLKAKGGNYLSFRQKAAKLNLNLPYLSLGPNLDWSIRRHMEDDTIFVEAKAVTSRRSLLTRLKLNPNAGSNVRWIKEKIVELRINTSHWKGQGSNKGQRLPGSKTNLDDIFSNKKNAKSLSLKLILIHRGILKNECSECGISNWRDRPLSLHLDHKDGDHSNCARDNLRLLCPNCHSQTPTYCRRKSSL